MKQNQPKPAVAQDEEIFFSIPDASTRMGVDSFTIYSLIQRDKLRAERAPWAEFRIPQSELSRILQPPGLQLNGEANEEEVC